MKYAEIKQVSQRTRIMGTQMKTVMKALCGQVRAENVSTN
jgi:hypothetical protein